MDGGEFSHLHNINLCIGCGLLQFINGYVTYGTQRLRSLTWQKTKMIPDGVRTVAGSEVSTPCLAWPFEGLNQLTSVHVSCHEHHNVYLFCSIQNQPKFDNITFSDYTLKHHKVVNTVKGASYVLKQANMCSYKWFHMHNICLQFFECITQSDCGSVCTNQGAHVHNLIATNEQFHTFSSVFNFGSFNCSFVMVDLSTTDIRLVKLLQLFQRRSYGKSMERSLMIEVDLDDNIIEHLCTKHHIYPCDAARVWIEVTANFHEQLAKPLKRLWSLDDTVTLVVSFGNNSACKQSDIVACEQSSASPDPTFLQTCPQDYFRCSDGTCLYKWFLCDGKIHCIDGEDELQCGHVCSADVDCFRECNIENGCHCLHGYFPCLTTGCIPHHQLCDEVKQCADGSDELAHCPQFSDTEYVDHLQSVTELETDFSCVKYNTSTLQTIVIPAVGFVGKSSLPDFLNPPVEFAPFDYFPCTDLPYKDRIFMPMASICNYEYTLIKQPQCVDRDLADCTNGFHLRNCAQYSCTHMFKCHLSYCIHYHRVCDDYCDCVKCEDEECCDILTCPGMLKVPSEVSSQAVCQMQDSSISAFSGDYEQLSSVVSFNSSETSFPERGVIFIDLKSNSDLPSSHLVGDLVGVFYFLRVEYHNLSRITLAMMQSMVSLKYLYLGKNSVREVDNDAFLYAFQLVVLDLSFNQIYTLSDQPFCPLHALKYLYINNNVLRDINKNIFITNTQLYSIDISNNLFSAIDHTIFSNLGALSSLISDHPGLCCIKKFKQCLPKFNRFSSCKDLIKSFDQKIVLWVISLYSTLTSFICVIILMTSATNLNIVRSIRNKPIVGSLLTADLCVSLCLLCLAFVDLYYKGLFGLLAEFWRGSFFCKSLEMMMFIGSNNSLIFLGFMSIVTTVDITTLRRGSLFRMKGPITVWLLSTSCGVTRQVLLSYLGPDPYNYFCLPFQFSPHGSLWFLMCIQIVFASTVICIIICADIYLLKYLFNFDKVHKISLRSTKSFSTRKVAIRVSLLIVSSILSWLPILITQSMILLNVFISKEGFLG